MSKSPELAPQWLEFEPGQVREVFWMPLRSAAVSHVFRHGFPPLLNPAVEKTTCTLRTDTDITKIMRPGAQDQSSHKGHKTHTYIQHVLSSMDEVNHEAN